MASLQPARGWFAAGALLLIASMADRANAGPWDACFHATKVDATIAACTREIARHQNPGHAGAHDLATGFFNRGQAMLKLDFDRAMADFNRSIEIDPGIAEVYDTRGVQYQYRKHDLASAIADFSQAIRLAPANVHFLRHRALALRDSGDYHAALTDFDQAIKLAPGVDEYLGRGAVFDRKADYDRAIADFGDAIRLEPKNSTAWFDRAVVYLRKGDFAQAIKDDTTALGLAAPGTLNVLTYRLFRGRLALISADYATASADFEAVVKDHPDHATAVLWLYLARARSRDPNAAPALATDRQRIEASPKPDPIFENVYGTSRALLPVAGLLLGEQTAEATLAAAARPDQACQMQFFIGEWGLLHADATTADRHFRAAVAPDCPTDAFEYYAARAELDRLRDGGQH